jgi:hypothetical protein
MKLLSTVKSILGGGDYLLLMCIIITAICIIIYILFQNRKEHYGCDSSKTCCPAGSYGNNSTSCTNCPLNRPASNWGISDNDCKCSTNDTLDKCYACNDLCKPFNPTTKRCTSKLCPSGKTCSSATGKCA